MNYKRTVLGIWHHLVFPLNVIFSGYWHEQSRADRNSYIKINWNNVIPRMKNQFQKCVNCDDQGLEYDVGSIMHYHAYAFAKNRKRPTITQLKETSLSIGQRNKLSVLDIKGINRLYCHNYTSDCVDKNEQCSEFPLKLCNDVERREWMVENCAGRCKVCYGGINCEDKYDQTIRKPRCQSWVEYCTSSAWKGWMATNCALTCKACS